MGEKQKSQFQCINCGTLHWIEDPPDIDEDELYIQLRCNCCKHTTDHLWVGNDSADLYLYYDVNADPRYYEYNTK